MYSPNKFTIIVLAFIILLVIGTLGTLAFGAASVLLPTAPLWYQIFAAAVMFMVLVISVRD